MPRASLIAIVAAMPVAALDFSWASGSAGPLLNEPFSLPRLAVLALLAPSAAALLVARRTPPHTLRSTSVDWMLVVFLALASASTAVSVHRATSLIGAYGRFEGLVALMCYALVYVLALNVTRSTRDIEAIVATLTLASIPAALIGMAQYLGWYGASWDLSAFRRPFSTFGNPDFFGGFLAFVMPVALAFALHARQGRWKVLSWTATLLSGSLWVGLTVRSAWIAGVVALSLIAIILWRTRHRFTRTDVSFAALGALAVLAVVVRSTALPPTERVLERVPTVFQTSGFGAASRFELWRGAVTAAAERPFLGWGVETFRYVYPRFESVESVRLNGYDNFADNAHNHLLNTAATVGVPGAIALYAFVGLVLVRAARRILLEPRGAPIVYGGLFAACVGYLIHLQFSISVPATTCLWWIGLGVLAAPDARTLDRVSRHVATVVSAGLGVLGTVFVLLVVPSLLADASYLRARTAPDFPSRSTALNTAVRFGPLIAEYRVERARQHIEQVTSIAASAQRAAASDGDATSLEHGRAVYSIAEQTAIDARDFVPQEPTTYVRLSNLYNAGAVIHEDRGYLEKALVAAQDGLAIAPNRPDLLVAAATALMNLDRRQEAAPLLEMARLIDPRYPDSWLRLARVRELDGFVEDAVRLLEEGLAASPDDARLRDAIERLRSLEPTPAP